MEDVKVFESLDSLWFFNNVFSSSFTKPLSIVSDNDHIIKSKIPKSDLSKDSKPITPTAVIHQTQIPIDSVVLEECPKCSNFVTEKNRVWGKTGEGEEKKERRIRKKRRSKGDSAQIRRVVNWLDFGFDLNEIDEFCMRMMMDGKSKAYDLNGMMKMNMPSFSDEMAMREHLKSWAYSVACAVK